MKNMLKKLMSRNEIGTLLPLLVLCIVIGIVNIDFFQISNIIDVFRTASYSFMIAAPLTGLMIAGSMDLTIGAVTSIGGVVCAWCLVGGLPIPAAILITLAVGVLLGSINAWVVVKQNLPAFIVTLGLQYAINGFILITTQGIPISVPGTFKVFGQGRLFDSVYYSIIFAILEGIVFHILFSKTKYGRSLYAVGGNEETAKLAGINVHKTRFLITIIVSVFAVICGMFMCSRFVSAQSAAGSGTEMTIMAAVIIGGTSMYGGSGTIVGSALGCLLLAVINNGLVLMHISTYWQSFIFGLILVISLFIDKYRQMRSTRV